MQLITNAVALTRFTDTSMNNPWCRIEWIRSTINPCFNLTSQAAGTVTAVTARALVNGSRTAFSTFVSCFGESQLETCKTADARSTSSATVACLLPNTANGYPRRRPNTVSRLEAPPHALMLNCYMDHQVQASAGQHRRLPATQRAQHESHPRMAARSPGKKKRTSGRAIGSCTPGLRISPSALTSRLVESTNTSGELPRSPPRRSPHARHARRNR